MLLPVQHVAYLLKMSDKSVLLEFMGSKRSIAYKEEEELTKLCENEIKKIVKDDNIRVITDVDEYTKEASEKPYLLQRYSKEWQQFVDVIDTIEIDDKDHLMVVPLPGLSPEKVNTLIIFFTQYRNRRPFTCQYTNCMLMNIYL